MAIPESQKSKVKMQNDRAKFKNVRGVIASEAKQSRKSKAQKSKGKMRKVFTF